MNESPQGDYRVILGLCALTAAAVAPFFVYHTAHGAWSMAGNTGFIVAFTLAAIAWLYPRRHDSILIRRAGMVIVLVANGTIMLSILAQQQNTIYWIYPLIFVNFYLLPLRPALGINLASCGLGFWLVIGVVPDAQLARIAGSIPLCIFFGLVFSQSIQRQRDKLHYLANHDSLTGVGNRHGLDGALREAAERLRRYGEVATLILADADHFKSVNDRLGHLKGDEIIVELARLFRDRLRKTDRLFRFGGEEFVMLLPHTSAAEGHHLAESLRIAVAKHDFAYGQSLTISAGVAELAEGEVPDSWLDRADQALYEAKDAGRNRVVAAGAYGERSDT